MALSPTAKRALFGAIVGGTSSNLAAKQLFRPDTPIQYKDEFGVRRKRILTPQEMQRKKKLSKAGTLIGGTSAALVLPAVIRKRIAGRNIADLKDLKKLQQKVRTGLLAAELKHSGGATPRARVIRERATKVLEPLHTKVTDTAVKKLSREAIEARRKSLFGDPRFNYYPTFEGGRLKLKKKPSKYNMSKRFGKFLFGKNKIPMKTKGSETPEAIKKYIDNLIRPKEVI